MSLLKREQKKKNAVTVGAAAGHNLPGNTPNGKNEPAGVTSIKFLSQLSSHGLQAHQRGVTRVEACLLDSAIKRHLEFFHSFPPPP